MGLFIVGGTHFLYFCILVYLGYAGDGFLNTEKSVCFIFLPQFYFILHNAIDSGKSYKEIDISFKCQVYEMIDNTK